MRSDLWEHFQGGREDGGVRKSARERDETRVGFSYRNQQAHTNRCETEYCFIDL